MKKILSTTVFAAFLLGAVSPLTASIPEATPKTAPDFPVSAHIWIPGNKPVRSNFGSLKVEDSFSGEIPYLMQKMPEKGEFSIRYEFEVKQAGDYEFFAALITQKRPHGSPVEFRFDDGAWKEVPNSPQGQPAWGVSNAVTWNALGFVKLGIGRHSVELRTTSRAALGNWSFMCDGLVAFRWEPAPLASVGEGTPPALSATPAQMPDFPKQAAIWIGADKAVNTNIGKRKVDDSFSGEILYLLQKAPESGEFFAEYRFEVPKAGEYDFFAALITQGRPHGSPVEFRFDDESFQTVRPSAAKRSAWGVSRAVNWEYLGSRTFEPGTHTLTFRTRRRASLGNWSFMCDGVIGLEKGVWKSARIFELAMPELNPGSDQKITFQHAGPGFPAEVRLTFAGEPVMTAVTVCRPGENQVVLPVPEFLGVGEYRAELAPLDAPRQVIAVSPVVRIAAPVSNRPARLTGVKVTGVDYVLQFDGTEALPVAAQLFIDGRLYAVDRLDTATGTFSEALCRAARGRKAILRFTPLPAAAGNVIETAFPLSGSPQALSKPINYGTFSDRDGVAHFWYMNHDHEYIFDGERYFPVGGMWCPDTLISGDSDPAGIAGRLKKDRGTIDAIRTGGLDDVYLNLSCVAPLWVRQSFVDLLEREGIQYGYQLNAGGGAEIPAFFISRDRSDAPENYRGLSRGRYSNGRISASFPAEQKLAGLLVLDPADPAAGAEFTAFSDRVGKDLRHGIIDLETVQDFGRQREISLPVRRRFAEGTEVVLLPLLDAKMHHADLWNEYEYAKLKQDLSWIGKINWGRNLRFLVDPIRNETNMVNGTENLRQYTASFNRAFSDYLEKRYGTIEALRREWGTSGVESFDEAARLVPLRLGDGIWWIDPERGRVHPGKLDSFAWIDYQDALRETYSELADGIAAYLKTLVNVPVVFKSVGVIGEKMSISRRYLGCDGIGFECYLNQGIPGETGGGASRAEAEASEHTMWKVGTEVGHSAAVANDGTKFFTDEAELRGMAEELLRLGVRGLYFFGFDLKPGNLWGNHSYHDFPEGLAWAARIENDFVRPSAIPVAATPRNYVFPGGFTWWWWTTRYKALFGYEQNLIPQSARLGRNSVAWFSSTNVLPADFDAVLINCPRPPFSRRFAAEIERAIASGRPVCYVGERTDPGAIPALDRFFSPEKITFADGSVAQALKVVPGSRVLASEEGRPWALQAGNLLIVSRTPVEAPVSNSDDFLKYLVELCPAWPASAEPVARGGTTGN